PMSVGPETGSWTKPFAPSLLCSWSVPRPPASPAAFEAMQRCFPDHLLLVPTGKGSLPNLEKLGIRLPDAVIWLDELDRYLGEDGLTTSLLERLTEQGGLVFLGIIELDGVMVHGVAVGLEPSPLQDRA